MHGAPVFKVPAQAHGQPGQPPFFPLYGQQIRQRLRGVKMPAVARVDDRDVDVAGGHQRRALFGVAHRNDVGKAGNDPRGVGHAFAFRGRAAGCL
ncbi:hypothetical protein SDC9_144224 [bioreactor metagenome]|uniref:Uncharacterized protein n=1 Tax=bioreactor metagenome TaxID=1076179 RepID=A0A645E662_9ZZZZ